MAYLKKYKDKKIAIYGMGLTGYSAAKFFQKLKAKVYCWDDDNKIRNKVKKSNLNLNKFWLSQDKVHNILISPGIDINNCKIKNYLKKNFKKIITDLDLFFEINKKASIISITGTNGKSTTCKIVEKILKTAKYNVVTAGNIGNPILSIQKTKKKKFFILEISSYQLQYSKLFKSHHAAILNISPDHLERHKNLKNYIKIKSRIFFGQNNSDYSYINLNNKHSKSIKNIFKKKKLKSKLNFIKKSDCKFLIKKVNNKYFKGEGNIENLAFAYKIAKNLKIKNSTILNAINNFKGLPHRQEIIFSNKNLTFVNDSKATSFSASLQSLKNYNNIFWIVGGMPKYKDIFKFKNIYQKIQRAYVIGKNVSHFIKQINGKIPYTISKNMGRALEDIFKDIRGNGCPNCTILLSPAAASFDQFKNFEDRGNIFKKLAKKQIKKVFNV